MRQIQEWGRTAQTMQFLHGLWYKWNLIRGAGLQSPWRILVAQALLPVRFLQKSTV